MELASDLIKQGLAPCVVCSLKFQEKIHNNNFIDIFFTCSIMSTVSNATQTEESKQATENLLEEVHDNPFQIKIKKETATTLKQKAE